MSTNTSSETTPADGPAADAPDGDSEESQKFFATHDRFAAASRPARERPSFTARNPTGAFENPLTSFRFSPRPYRFRDVLLGAGVLYGAFIGVPAGAGAWAAWRIWLEVHG